MEHDSNRGKTMHNAPIFKRRTFLQNVCGFSILFSLTGLSIFSGCSGGGNSSYDPNSALDDGGSCIVNGTQIEVQVVHLPNHALLISKDDVNAGVQKTFTLENSGSGHVHSVTLSSADFATLRTNSAIQLTSTTEAGHSHVVAIGCA